MKKAFLIAALVATTFAGACGPQGNTGAQGPAGAVTSIVSGTICTLDYIALNAKVFFVAALDKDDGAANVLVLAKPGNYIHGTCKYTVGANGSVK